MKKNSTLFLLLLKEKIGMGVEQQNLLLDGVQLEVCFDFLRFRFYYFTLLVYFLFSFSLVSFYCIKIQI